MAHISQLVRFHTALTRHRGTSPSHREVLDASAALLCEAYAGNWIILGPDVEEAYVAYRQATDLLKVLDREPEYVHDGQSITHRARRLTTALAHRCAHRIMLAWEKETTDLRKREDSPEEIPFR